MEAETPQGTIIYREVFTYEFDEEKSHPLKDSDKVTVVNPVAAVSTIILYIKTTK